jgi:hypothetical protein
MTEARRKFDADFWGGTVRLADETDKPITQVARDLRIDEDSRHLKCATNVKKSPLPRRRLNTGVTSPTSHTAVHNWPIRACQQPRRHRDAEKQSRRSVILKLVHRSTLRIITSCQTPRVVRGSASAGNPSPMSSRAM